MAETDGGGLGGREFAFTSVATYVACKGLDSWAGDRGVVLGGGRSPREWLRGIDEFSGAGRSALRSRSATVKE
ncbi:hypothetical protein AB0C13_35980 [Streptomyces sp. NPDC049099]|uniref:hypothetical protein n=1 Tax=Streptomyces sp. NPDC049099 TaxID=3155768 RepID=UPI0034158833